MVCEPLIGQPLNLASENFPYLAGLESADFSSLEDSLDIGILVGADQYWKLVTGKILHEGTGPTNGHRNQAWLGTVWSRTRSVTCRYMSQLCVYPYF